MERRRDDGWETNNEVYTEEQIESVLNEIGIEVEGQTTSHFLAYCPFHGNRDTPAFEVNKTNGLWICFNPGCGMNGNLNQLIRRVTGIKNEYDIYRIILKHRNFDPVTFAERIRENMAAKPEFVEFPQNVLDRLYDDFWSNEIAQKYMMDRHFTEETLRYFRIGYSAKTDKVIVPMHDPDGMPIGLIGRTPSFTDKSFKNSTKLPKSKTAFNMHRAKKTGDTVIVVEASFDAMRVHQAGYPNVVALLGGSLSPYHIDQFNRYFSKIIIMTDLDIPEYAFDGRCKVCKKYDCNGCSPGRILGNTIARELSRKRVLWAVYDDDIIYPHNAKDIGDMTDEEIRQCLKNAISTYEYSLRSLPWE